ncbi:MAG: hypothetical protein R3D34_03190 [Nitratireductor sp.]
MNKVQPILIAGDGSASPASGLLARRAFKSLLQKRLQLDGDQGGIPASILNAFTFPIILSCRDATRMMAGHIDSRVMDR